MGRTMYTRSAVTSPWTPAGPFDNPPVAPEIRNPEMRRLIRATSIYEEIQGFELTDHQYLDGRERAMATYYPDYVSRSPEELLKGAYAGIATLRGKVQAAAVGSSASSSSAAAPPQPLVGQASRLADPGRGTHGRSRSRAPIQADAPERAARHIPYKAPPPDMPPRSGGASRPAGTPAVSSESARPRPHEPPLQDREPVAGVSRASRPADSDRWRPSLAPASAQQRAILTSAQQVADRVQEEHWARLRRQREEFAVERTLLGAGSASSAAAPVEPEPDLWRN
jgi:hypothetical protein